MKMILLMSLIISASAFGVELSISRSTDESRDVQKFILTPKKSEYQKGSNFFDKTEDYRIGSFSSANTKNMIQVREKLEAILKKIKVVDNYLQTKNSNFNELSAKESHGFNIKLDGFVLTSSSDMYDDVFKSIVSLQTEPWNQVDGLKVSKDLKELKTVKSGKETSTEKFDVAKSCRPKSGHHFCRMKTGFLYLLNQK